MLHSESIIREHGRGRGTRVGYVLKRFPRLTETFILNEILELERQGVHVEIYSLLRPRDEPRHDLLRQLKANVHYLPEKSAVESWTVHRANGETDIRTEPLSEYLGHSNILPDLMPGKKPHDAALLMHRAMTIALLAQANGIQHLHAHFGSDATTAALLAGRITGLPFSYTAHARDIYHTYVSPEADRRMRRLKLNEARFVATVSDYNREHLRQIAGGSGVKNIVRLYNGIDLDRFGQATNIRRQSNQLLCVGRLVEKKGIGDLISACKLLSRSNVKFECTVVGDGPLRGDYEAAVEAAGLAKHVRFTGALQQAEVLSLMRWATIMILPCVVANSGDRDGLPTVLLEALACGLPAISTRVAGIPEIIGHGQNGLLVAPNSPTELAVAISSLLADEKRRARFAEAGRRKAVADFSLTTNVARLRSLFETSIGVGAPEQEGHDRAHRIH